MNKRAAMTLAGGVTGALVSAVAGYSLSLNRAVADGAPAKPIVRTEIRTITIHRKAKPKVHPPQAPTTVVVRTAPPAAQAAPVHHTGGSAHGGDDGGSDGGGDD